jgi:hypothetical protein
MIPKIIHQVWLRFGVNGATEPPARYDASRASWHKHHRDWKIILWDDAKVEAFLREHYAWFWPWYCAYKADIYRADAIRYFLLYHYGGAYVDIDMECLRPLTPLCSKAVVLTRTPHRRNYLSNYFMMATPRHAFFAHCMGRLTTAHQSMWHWEKTFVGTMSIAGPKFLFGCYNTYPEREALTVLSFAYFVDPARYKAEEGADGVQGTNALVDENGQPVRPFAHHHFDSTWGSRERLFWDVLRAAIVLVCICALVWLVYRSRRRICSRMCPM